MGLVPPPPRLPVTGPVGEALHLDILKGDLEMCVSDLKTVRSPKAATSAPLAHARPELLWGWSTARCWQWRG